MLQIMNATYGRTDGRTDRRDFMQRVALQKRVIKSGPTKHSAYRQLKEKPTAFDLCSSCAQPSTSTPVQLPSHSILIIFVRSHCHQVYPDSASSSWLFSRNM